MDIKERIKDLSLDEKAKLYYMALFQKGMIDKLPENPKAAFVRDMMADMGKKDDEMETRYDFDDPTLNEGDTYEKMAAKGKKSGNLKQGTVRKRLGIKPGEKIPLATIAKELSRLKKMDKDDDKAGVQLGDKNQKYYKALQLAKTLKTTTNVNEEEDPVVAKGDGMEITRKEMAMLHKNGKVRLKDGSILTFINKKDKANLNEEQMPEKITFSYTDPGFSFYSMYYLINNDRKKLSSPMEASKFIKTLGVDEDVPRRYNETELDRIVSKLETKGIKADHNAFMDVS